MGWGAMERQRAPRSQVAWGLLGAAAAAWFATWMLFFPDLVAGNFAWDGLIAEVDKHCGSWRAGPVGRQGVRETKGSGAFEVMTKPKVTQEHVLVISPGPSANDPLRGLCEQSHGYAITFGRWRERRRQPPKIAS